MFFTLLIVSLALGAGFSALLLLLARRLILKKSGSLSAHGFRVSRQRPRAVPLNRSMDLLTAVLLYVSIFFFLFVLSLAAANRWLRWQPAALERAVELMRSGLDILLPTAVAVTVIFAGFKKPYYLLFTTRDVVLKFKLLPCMLLSTFGWLLAVAAQVAASLSPAAYEGFWPIVFHSYALLLLLMAAVCALTALVNSYRIFFSGRTTELKLLDTLITGSTKPLTTCRAFVRRKRILLPTYTFTSFTACWHKPSPCPPGSCRGGWNFGMRQPRPPTRDAGTVVISCYGFSY